MTTAVHSVKGDCAKNRPTGRQIAIRQKRIEGKSINIEEVVFYFFVFFPFVSMGVTFGTDMQPLALLFSTAVVFVNSRAKVPYELVVFSLSIIVLSTTVCFFSLLRGIGLFESLRSVANYYSIGIVLLASYIILKKNSGINERLIKIIILIWLAVALVQFFMDKDFGSFLLSSLRTSASRGVNSLTNEPSFYGYMCTFALILAQTFKRNRLLFSLILVIQIVFLAASAVSVVYLGVALVAYLIFNVFHMSLRAFFRLCLALLLCLLVLYVLITYIPSMRITYLLERSLTDPSSLLNDQSVAYRYSEIEYSIQQFISNYFLPSLFQGRRIISGYGSMLVELGVFGAFIIIGFTLVVYRSKLGSNCFRFVTLIMLTMMMFSGVQLSNPIFSFLLAYFALSLKHEERVKH